MLPVSDGMVSPMHAPYHSQGIFSTASTRDTQLFATLSANSCSSRANACTASVSSVFSRLWSTTRSSCHMLRGIISPTTKQGVSKALITHHNLMKTRLLSCAAIVTWSFSIIPMIRSASSCQPSFMAALTASSRNEFVSTRFLKRSTWSNDSRS
jgi:hypothetical protein